ncbi:histidine kinase [Halorubellus sp. JP-L1]|uniref:histidine kinase n=1 Tax=Halorubellus sp. JP-L1 TaxID=2715753 RepID=UPI00140DCFA9|nr:histidine kinase [Halorubellus sp. JP-L1]NHN42215.1 histidine kinase [Halorubellus sp. JP-L1]
MHLAAFVDDLEAPEVSLTVVNVDGVGSEHVAGMFEDLFERQSVAVETVVDAARDENLVLLERDGERVAESALADVGNAVLFVNSDVYISGSRELAEVETPAVLAALTDVPFRATGYPSTRKEKFLLVEISRFIEARAYREGAGRLHSGFQRLSRIDDEKGTQTVYETLAATDVDTHVYGAGDWTPSGSLSAHSGHPDLNEVWFVVYVPPEGAETDHAALVCVETDAGHWRGFWTFDAERVRPIESFVVDEYQS